MFVPRVDPDGRLIANAGSKSRASGPKSKIASVRREANSLNRPLTHRVLARHSKLQMPAAWGARPGQGRRRRREEERDEDVVMAAVLVAASAGVKLGAGRGRGRGVVSEMHAVPRHRAGRQDQARPPAQRHRWPQGRHLRGVQLFPRQQEFWYHLEPGSSSTSYIKNPMQAMPGTRMAFVGIRNEKEIDQPLGLPQPFQGRRLQEVTPRGTHAACGLQQTARSKSFESWSRMSWSTCRGGTAGLRGRLCGLASAKIFGAQVSGIAFCLDPVIPDTMLAAFPRT